MSRNATVLGSAEAPTAWHQRTIAEALAALAVDPTRGLNEAVVEQRRAKVGPNQLPERASTPLWRDFLGQFTSPLVWLLLIAAGIAFGLGERGDAAVIVAVLTVNAAVGTFQERRAARSMAALRTLTSVRTRVCREGREQTLNAVDLVPGDVLVLAAGDAVPADARLVEAAQLRCAEAALTGESAPVDKGLDPVPADTVLADRSCLVHSGTLVTSGRARAVVVATGPNSELGRIATLTQREEPPTPLEQRLARFGRFLVGLAVVMFVAVLLAGWLRGLPMAEVLMVGISQLVSVVPESLPIGLTVALALGTRRMAAANAIVRHLSAVETLGCATVICTDKTGTLTRNEMTVTKLWLAGRHLTVAGGGLEEAGRPVPLDAALEGLLTSGLACNDASLGEVEGAVHPVGDPTEVALLLLGRALRVPAPPPRTAELSFDTAARLMATAHGEVVYLKGAPEAVLRLCAPEARGPALEAAEAFSRDGLRVLAFASAKGPLDVAAGFEGLAGRATLLGLCGQQDPPRDGVLQAVQAAQAAGIRVAMVTGDHHATALSIARGLGIAREGDEVMDGPALAALERTATPAQLGQALAKVAVFSRVQPAQKLSIVEALQARGEVVAMTGDGVNDAPALVRSDVGVGMGKGGTDVAREASDIVLLDDDFGTIVRAVEAGRLVYRNIKKATVLLLASGVAEMVILVGAIALGLPMPFAAVQILWNNIATEGTVTLNLVLDPLEGDELRHPPVPRDEALVPRAALARLLFLGAVMAALVLGFYAWRRALGVAPDEVQTEAFSLLAVCEWFNVLNCRSERKSAFAWRLSTNRALLGGLALSVSLLLAVLYLPPLARIFHAVPLHPAQLGLVVVVASVMLWAEELRKLVARRLTPRQ